MRRLDRGRTVPIVEVALLRSLPHFADLPGPALETLAGDLKCVQEILPAQKSSLGKGMRGTGFMPSPMAKSKFRLTLTS